MNRQSMRRAAEKFTYEVVPFAKGTEIKFIITSFKILKTYEVVPFAKGTEISSRRMRRNWPSSAYEVVPFAKGTEIEGLERLIFHFGHLRSCPLREGD